MQKPLIEDHQPDTMKGQPLPGVKLYQRRQMERQMQQPKPAQPVEARLDLGVPILDANGQTCLL